jgi:hypothetical protein
MDEQSKKRLANEIRMIVISLNSKITEAFQQQIVTTITQEDGYYSRVSGTPGLVSVDIREEHIL